MASCKKCQKQLSHFIFLVSTKLLISHDTNSSKLYSYIILTEIVVVDYSIFRGCSCPHYLLHKGIDYEKHLNIMYCSTTLPLTMLSAMTVLTKKNKQKQLIQGIKKTLCQKRTVVLDYIRLYMCT